MAAVIRRHWKLALLHLLLVLGCAAGVVWLLSQRSGTVAVATPGAAELAKSPNPLAHSRLDRVRTHLGLTGSDLAAMGCGEAQAGRVLSELVSWYQVNAAAWDAAESERASAKRSLQESVRQINLGKADATAGARLPQLRETLQRSDQRINQMMEEAGQRVQAVLNIQQQQTWRVIRSNVKVAVPYRYAADLSAEQLKGLTTPAKNRASNSALSAMQRSTMDQALLALRTNMDAVSKAEREMLPMPVELSRFSKAAVTVK